MTKKNEILNDQLNCLFLNFIAPIIRSFLPFRIIRRSMIINKKEYWIDYERICSSWKETGKEKRQKILNKISIKQCENSIDIAGRTNKLFWLCTRTAINWNQEEEKTNGNKSILWNMKGGTSISHFTSMIRCIDLI